MWTPDVVFANQVSLERVSSAIKNESDAIAEIMKLPCTQNSRGLCEKLNLAKEKPGIKIFMKQTINVEVNCPEMRFGDFPFDTQTCPVMLVSMRELGTNKMSVKWKTLHVKWIKNQIREVVLNFDPAIFNSHDLFSQKA